MRTAASLNLKGMTPEQQEGAKMAMERKSILGRAATALNDVRKDPESLEAAKALVEATNAVFANGGAKHRISLSK